MELDVNIAPGNLESRRKNHGLRVLLRNTWACASNNQKKSTLILSQLSVFGRYSPAFSYPILPNSIKANQPI